MANNDLKVDPHVMAREFRDAPFGDRRLSARLEKIGASLSKAPEASIRSAMQSHAAEDAAYRFFSNEVVTPMKILHPHAAQTVERIASEGAALAIHDTSEFAFDGEAQRLGLGRLAGSQRQGFYAHVSLAVSADATHRPLGVMGLKTWARTGAKRRRPGDKRLNGDAYQGVANKESDRWLQQVEYVESLVGEPGRLIHVADREADSFVHFDRMIDARFRFVFRAARNRLVRSDDGDDDCKLRDVIAKREDIFSIDVPLSARKAKGAPRANETSGARNARSARLGVRATSCELLRPRRIGPKLWIPINVVEVHEIDAPADTVAVDWVLLTTEPIETAADVQAIINAYRARWLIEELFKALKTGCQIEKRQLESFEAIVNLLATCCPIAWQMLLLRNLSRSSPDSPATDALTPTQIDVLRACSSVKLGPFPTMRTALFAVASLGGHHDKWEPGWLVLGRGFERLLLLEVGWLAHQNTRGDL